MTANELRIGNWVKDFNGKPYEITPRFFCSVSSGMSFEEQKEAGFAELTYSVQPITLTPEILEKCGFVIPAHSYIGSVFHLTEWDAYPGEYCVAMNKNNAIIVKRIKYLHQLQNLYFALTGEELTVNL